MKPRRLRGWSKAWTRAVSCGPWTVIPWISLLLSAFLLWVPIPLKAAQATGEAGAGHRVISFDEDILDYRNLEAHGPVARLQKQLEQGEAALPRQESSGYLLSVLKALHVPVSSQVLVYSKTSLQRDHISPSNPRAIYFNDQVYVAWTPGAGLLEVSAVEPVLGGVWYTLSQEEAAPARFVRNNRCLECHVTSKTLGVPGHLFRSNVTDEKGNVDLLDSQALIDHRTPLAARWGGWYVTGTHGPQAHLGNLVLQNGVRVPLPGLSTNGNITDLSPSFDVSKYPEPHSDVVALMVLGHQLHMHNLITLLNYESSVHLARYGHVRYLREIVQDFLKYLLFVEEAPLTAPVRGTSTFAMDFEASGPRDSQGRSLRQLDLQTRLLTFPCSYLIYSPSFDQLPRELKLHLYRRLYDILTGRDESPAFQRIPAPTRQAILEILIQTKSGLPLYWTL